MDSEKPSSQEANSGIAGDGQTQSIAQKEIDKVKDKDKDKDKDVEIGKILDRSRRLNAELLNFKKNQTQFDIEIDESGQASQSSRLATEAVRSHDSSSSWR